MSGGDRNKRLAYWLAIATLSLLLVIAIGLGGWELKQGYNQEREYNGSANPKPGNHACLKIPFVIDTCTEQYEASAQKQRDDDDLEAQQEMADWAFAMAGISLGGLILSFGGILLVYKTLQKTAESVDLTRDQLIVENRPWLSLETEAISPLSADGDYLRIDVDFGIKNVGRSPALNVYFHAELRLAFLGDPSDNLYRQWQEIIDRTINHHYSGDVIFPDGTFRQTWKFVITPYMLTKRPDGAENSCTPWILGSVSYQTGVGEKKTLHTAVRMRFLDIGFSSDVDLLSFAGKPFRLERPDRRSIEIT